MAVFYGIGTMFSMGVLSAMVSIALDMVIRVSASFWTTALVNKFLLDGASSDGVTIQAMQQGGMGLILTTLILTAPQWRRWSSRAHQVVSRHTPRLVALR